MTFPKTFLIGYTTIHYAGLKDYLTQTSQMDFLHEVDDALENGLSLGEILCSYYAKLCYKSLVVGKNANIEKTRGIKGNLEHCFQVDHGSVFEHFWLNFVTTDCSRVFTHELVRHRVGTAFSQTSGRYVALDDIELVLPPEFTPASRGLVEEIRQQLVAGLKKLRDLLITDNMPMADKKKVTSAIRRIAPNGQTNEIGWSCNIRQLRHMLVMRTSRFAEWEIRVVFNQVASIVEARYPLMLYGLKKEMVDGHFEFVKE